MILTSKIKGQFLYLFADCYPVKGYKRSMIYDLTSKKVHFIPTAYFDLLQQCRKYKIGELYLMLNSPSDRQEFRKFLDYLVENNLAEWVDDITLFPPLNIEWHHPSEITNAIIDIDPKKKSLNYSTVFDQLDELGCYHIQVRAFTGISLSGIKKLLSRTRGKKFRSLQLLTKYDPAITSEQMAGIIAEFPVIDTIVVHSAPRDKLVAPKKKKYTPFGKIMYVTQTMDSCHSCGVININALNIPNIGGFMENKLYNGCLNRKISIDAIGDIKNCPSMTRSYGNIGSRTLKDVVDKEEGFRKLWAINKDQVKICKDCEYRYMCTDCRAYLQDPSDAYSKPAKCKYNPYLAKWEN
jgi:SPASM domain peptide maturase of grasp-with-spasm system